MRRCRMIWLVATVSAAGLLLSACGAPVSAPQDPQVISEKGTPFGDLLVPKARPRNLAVIGGRIASRCLVMRAGLILATERFSSAALPVA